MEEEEELEKDFQALVRVRNRLAKSPDSALPKIFSGLLPRLLERLERNQDRLGKQQRQRPSLKTTQAISELLLKNQTQLNGILSNVLDRIREGRHTLPPGAPWVRALLPLLHQRKHEAGRGGGSPQSPPSSLYFQSPLANTFLLLILQYSIPRCVNDDNEDVVMMEDVMATAEESHPDISTILPPVLEFVHQLHGKIAGTATTSHTIPESLLLNYRTASWICYDIVALSWGLPTLLEMDRDRDHFDEYMYDWCTPTSAKESFLEHGPSKNPHNKTYQQRSVVYIATAGSFHLWLDLLLFWPAHSRLNNNNDNNNPNRRLVRSTAAEILVENSTGMTPQGLLRLNHRCNRMQQQGQPTTYPERYLRELKLACMECIVIEPLRSVVTENGFDFAASASADNDNNIIVMRSLILCILTASTGSMHGKIAINYVNKFGRMISNTRSTISSIARTSQKQHSSNYDTSSSCRSQAELNKSSDHGWGVGEEWSLLLACSLLSLMLGDRLALEALEKHPRQRKQIESVLGPFATSHREQPSSHNDAMEEGEQDEQEEGPLERAPMPFGVAERAMDFIVTRLLPPSSSDERDASLPNKAAAAGYSGLIDLLAQLPQLTAPVGSYWAINCLERLADPIGSLSHKAANKTSSVECEGWFRNFHEVCLNIASQVLSQIAEVDAEAMIPFGEIQQPRNPHELLPGGVPGPFHGRRDLNVMLAQHRSSQKKRQLQVTCALKARRAAYRMISELTKRRDLVDVSATILEMPIILLKCATGEEDPAMHPHLNEALEAVLATYKNAIPNIDTKRLRGLAASLLPSLLCAVCADSSISRLAAIRWVIEFVSFVDPGVALHVCAFMKDDVDANVSGQAKKALKSRLVDTMIDVETNAVSCQIQILNMNKDEGREFISNELKGLVEETSSTLGISQDVACALLSDFKFDAQATRDAYKSDPAATLSQSGIMKRCNEDVLMMDSGTSESECGICYDEKPSHMYGMHCGHQFCHSCWRSYLACQLMERPSSATTPLRVVCPEQECNERVLLDDIRAVEVVAPLLLERWEGAYLQSYVTASTHMSWCPGPDCSALAYIPMMDMHPRCSQRAVQCSECSASFCFSCGSDPHQPANCDHFAEWSRIFGSSQYWVKKNAKPCPNCKVPIEKNQGCNHMRCSQCGHDFCWLCLAHLRSHLEPHICNRYEPHQSSEDEEERRALFFTDRFKAHDDAEVFAKGELKSFEEKTEKLASEKLWFASDEDLDNLLHGHRSLVRARRFLKNSYVAAWAMRKDVEHRVEFESHQANLELFTEKLSQLLLTKVQQLYTEQGAVAIHMHFRAVVFSTASVIRYMDRMEATATT